MNRCTLRAVPCSVLGRDTEDRVVSVDPLSPSSPPLWGIALSNCGEAPPPAWDKALPILVSRGGGYFQVAWKFIRIGGGV